MRLTKRFRIKPTDELTRLCRVSNDLYNQSLHHWQQRRDADGVFLSFYDLRDEMRNVENLEGKINYRLMLSHVSANTVKWARQNIDSFYKAIKEWKKHPEKFKSKPEFPRYLKRGGLAMVQIDNHDFRISDGRIIYNRTAGHSIDIPQYEVWEERFKSAKMVRIIPKRNYMVVEVVYEVEQVPADVDSDRMAAIDFGIDNLCTLVSPSGSTIYSGKSLKAYNQQFNKRLASALSILYKQNPDKKPSSLRIRQMYDKRDRFVETFMHTVSKRIVDQLVSERVGVLIVGNNKGWKQNADIGKVNNQKFTQIPFFKLQGQLKYKCEMVGIKYVEQEESHTSKCDALGMEEIGHHDNYAGRRKKRGLFQSSTGTLVNADVNGALNIMRKHVGDKTYMRVMKDWKNKPPRVVSVSTNFKQIGL